MKKKSLIIVLFLFCILLFALYKYFSAPNGSTIESREALLDDIPQGTSWKIAIEQQFEDYIVSGIYSSDDKSGIAVFEPIGNGKYKLASREWRKSNEVIISGVVINNVWYDVAWFNGAETDYAEFSYTIDNKEYENASFETDNMEILMNAAPSKDYTLEVVYYDNEGNRYE